jgi:hypothetical protein
MDCFAEFIIGRRFAPTRWLAMTAVISQNFSTQGRNSISQVQALRGCCSTLQ